MEIATRVLETAYFQVNRPSGRGEEVLLLSNRKFKVISYSPLLPAPRSPASFGQYLIMTSRFTLMHSCHTIFI